MSEEDLELLITLDDPEGAPEEDIFNHLQAENTLDYDADMNRESELSSPVQPTERFNSN